MTENTIKFVSPESPPEGLDRELLTILAEECCEVGQRVSKALRFGLSEVQPGQPLTNTERISEEVGDLIAVVETLTGRGILSKEDISEAIRKKYTKLEKYLQSDS
jgi:NTP pyrophosphatase (non-canonical NTP hydrolase)